MKNQKLLLAMALSLLLFACAKETDQATLEPSSELEVQLPDISEGVSHLLTPEQLRFFEPGVLEALDELLLDLEQEDIFRSNGNVVQVPAGSNDALAAAIAQAGAGGTIELEGGDHFESQTVMISHKVKVVGKAGARLIMDTRPFGQLPFVQPGIHILNADGVMISGIEFRPKGDIGGTAILVENSKEANISNNNFAAFQFSIVLEHGDQAVLYRNMINTTTAWQTGDIPTAHGIVVSNGDHVRILNNTVINSVFGVFASDHSGQYIRNTTTNNFIGFILCKVPMGLTLENGQVFGAENPSTGWFAFFNYSADNLDAGYMAVDGATQNYLFGNRAANNGTLDIDLVGPSERFGFSTPTSSHNRVLAFLTTRVKDCGEDNVVLGGSLVDNDEEPCF